MTFQALDAFIDQALAIDAVPTRFVMTSERLAELIEADPFYEGVRVNNWPQPFRQHFTAQHAELFPERETVSGAVREITRRATEAMRVEVQQCGVTHYRNIPIEIDDTQDGFCVEWKPWGEPA